MALIKCGECEKEISSAAVTCPNCGHPITAASQPQPQATSLQKRERIEESRVRSGVIGRFMRLAAGTITAIAIGYAFGTAVLKAFHLDKEYATASLNRSSKDFYAAFFRHLAVSKDIPGLKAAIIAARGRYMKEGVSLADANTRIANQVRDLDKVVIDPLPSKGVRASVPSIFPTEEPPPKSEIDRAINLALARRIAWEVVSKDLFADYKITNEYKEKGRGHIYFNYDFTAECDVASDGRSISFDENGREHSSKYIQPDYARLLASRNPSAQSHGVEQKRISLTGSVTLVKKGTKWYIE